MTIYYALDVLKGQRYLPRVRKVSRKLVGSNMRELMLSASDAPNSRKYQPTFAI
jgi:hypothetical protein